MVTEVSTGGRVLSGWMRRLPPGDGRVAPYVNLDNAATTPPLRDVMEAVERSCRTTPASIAAPATSRASAPRPRSEAHETIARVRRRRPGHACRHLRQEHHRGDQQAGLPLPAAADAIVLDDGDGASLERPAVARPRRVVHVGVAAPTAGSTKTTSTRCSPRYAGRVALVAVTGASNVTGFIPPIHRLARKAHAVGRADPRRRRTAGAASAPSTCAPHDDPAHLDFVAFSAHKMYAPFGTGALIGRREAFARRAGASRRRHGRRRDARRRHLGRTARPRRSRHARTSSAPWRWPRRRAR